MKPPRLSHRRFIARLNPKERKDELVLYLPKANKKIVSPYMGQQYFLGVR